jgi:hypothetical protein
MPMESENMATIRNVLSLKLNIYNSIRFISQNVCTKLQTVFNRLILDFEVEHHIAIVLRQALMKSFVHQHFICIQNQY